MASAYLVLQIDPATLVGRRLQISSSAGSHHTVTQADCGARWVTLRHAEGRDYAHAKRNLMTRIEHSVELRPFLPLLKG